MPEQPSAKARGKLITIITLLVVTSMALILRLAYTPHTGIEQPVLRGDAREYAFYAYNIVNSRTFSKQPPQAKVARPDDFRSPGYPLLIAAALALAGIKWFVWVMYSQAVLGALLVPVVFFLGRKFLPLWAAAVAALFTGLSPHLVTIGGTVLAEVPFALTHLCALAVFYAAVKNRNVWLFALSGALFGYAYLLNPIIFFLPWILAALAVLGEEGPYRSLFGKSLFGKPIIRKLGIFLLLFSIFPGGWGVRNAVSLPSERGTNRALLNIVVGSHPDFARDWRAEQSPGGRPGARELATDAAYREYRESNNSFSRFARIFFSRFRESPVRYLGWYAFEKPYVLWKWNLLIAWNDVHVYPPSRPFYEAPGLARFTKTVMQALHPVVLIAVIAGLWPLASGIRKKETGLLDAPVLLYATLFYVTLIYVVFQAEPRYSIPFRPELYLAAAWALYSLSRRLKTRKTAHARA